ncbi:hypothetical protein [Brevundimonas sp.]|uniref:hypothetical protein n=1 Tax=Brevundimonas sp. TaxID=1871086 RepID=UPI0025C2096D|nr:hypothetical protein [Brevundimonas sp.]
MQQELHVDGGVNTPFLGVPEGMILSGETLPGWRGSELFIIVNGKLGLSRRQTRGSLPSVFARSYQSMTQSLLRTSLAAQGAFARRNGMRISVAAIPQEVEASALDFDQDAMKALFEEGRRRAVSGNGWVPLDAEVVEPPSPQDAEPAAEAAPDGR